jgi:hypothetical protein
MFADRRGTRNREEPPDRQLQLRKVTAALTLIELAEAQLLVADGTAAIRKVSGDQPT